MTTAASVPVTADQVRAQQLATLIEVASIPTASGREGRVIAFIRRWAASRPDVQVQADAAGNLVLSLIGAAAGGGAAPVFFTAHLDHPGFVVERIIGPGTVEVSFRGGVMDVFFEDAPIMLYRSDDVVVHAQLTGKAGQSSPAGEHYLAELHGEDDPTNPAAQADAGGLAVGDVGTWLMPSAEMDGQGLVHAPGCDDLSAVAAALCALDGYRAALAGRAAPAATADVRLLFTRAEEIGFIGAIAACRRGTMPRGSRVIALENSRSFADSPIGGGPIVRVGDRMSTFTPWLTGVCAARAEEVFGVPAQALSSQKATAAARPWQRKLMAGGACEASVFCHAGYDATCLCLPLGNYHNMAHLDVLQAGTYDRAALGPPRAAREYIHSWDYFGLVDLLVALALKPPEPDTGQGAPGSPGARFDKLLREKGYVLES